MWSPLETHWFSNLSSSGRFWEGTNTNREIISPYLNQKLSLKPRPFVVLRPSGQALTHLPDMFLFQQTKKKKNKNKKTTKQTKNSNKTPKETNKKITYSIAADYQLMNTLFPKNSSLLESWSQILDFFNFNSSSAYFSMEFQLNLVFFSVAAKSTEKKNPNLPRISPK